MQKMVCNYILSNLLTIKKSELFLVLQDKYLQNEKYIFCCSVISFCILELWI
jgi:hypothetical protein